MVKKRFLLKLVPFYFHLFNLFCNSEKTKQNYNDLTEKKNKIKLTMKHNNQFIQMKMNYLFIYFFFWWGGGGHFSTDSSDQ